MRLRWFWATFIIILVAAFSIRSVDLTRLPVYLDEAQHIPRAQSILRGERYEGDIRKMGLYYTLAVVDPTGPGALWQSRVVLALAGTLTTAATIGLGMRLHREETGLIAGAIYAVLPFAVFHERVVLADPLVAMWGMLALILLVDMVRRPRPLLIVGLGVSIAAAFLMKQTGLAFFPIAIGGALLFAWGREAPIKRVRAVLGALLLAALCIALAYSLRGRVHGLGLNEVLVEPVLGAATGVEQSQEPDIGRNMTDFARITWQYVGAMGVVSMGLAGLHAIFRPDTRPAVFYMMGTVVSLAVPIIVGRGIPTIVMVPRYFAPVAAPLAVLMALGIMYTALTLRRWQPQAAAVAVAASLALIIVPALRFDSLLIAQPQRAPLYTSQRSNWINGSLSGGGHGELAAALDAHGQDEVLHVLGSTKSVLWMQSLLGSRQVATADFTAADSIQQFETIAGWLAAGEGVYFLSSDPAFDAPHSTQITAVETITTNAYGPMTIWAVTGAEAPLADAILSSQARAFDAMTGDFDAVNAAVGDTPLVMFPAEQAALFAAHYERDLVAMSFPTWPVTPELSERVAEDAQQAIAADVFSVVLVDQTVIDPQRVVVQGLYEQTYWVQSEWFGLIQHQTVAAGVDEVRWQTVDAHFENVIHLHEVAFAETTIAPGDSIRVEAIWSIDEPTEDLWQFFVHLVTTDGQLVAQNDHEAGGGLFPMPSWAPGERISDRFAVLTPPDLAPGTYELRTGIYHPVNGLRLPVTAGGQGDSLLLATITVEEPSQ